jgi:hypothetical protein
MQCDATVEERLAAVLRCECNSEQCIIVEVAITILGRVTLCKCAAVFQQKAELSPGFFTFLKDA